MMTASSRTSLKMSWAQGQSSGWTAFDLKQRQKNGIEAEADKEPFPTIGTSNSMQYDDKFIKKGHVPVKPFSSVLLPAKNFPPLKEGGNNQTLLTVSDSHGKDCGTTAQKDVDLTIKKLKEQHCWADNSLIEDILAAVNNDADKATTLLETMTSAVNFEELKVPSDPRAATSDYIHDEEKTGERLLLDKVNDVITIHSSVVDHDKDNDDKDLEDRNTDVSPGEKLSDDDNVRCELGLLNFVPVEPEWEEDDIYLSHRKDALKTMRSASQHSRAAANAFLRGDHISAQQHSMKAQEEWYTAEELNSKAATKILNIRNSENDIWKLDLHGLHAGEAIQALQEHLDRIESQGFSKTSNSVKENGLANSNLGSLNSMDRESLDKQTPIRLRSPALHVITGIGNHSRGLAALPTAVRSFLNENRYRFDEMRPGVITVWPKFRRC